MSKIHILGATDEGQYRVVLHFNMPPGNNSAGLTWKSAYVNNWRLNHISQAGAILAPYSIMEEGTGPGQITTAERNQVIAGDVIEIVASIRAESGGTTAASLTAMADQIIAETQARLARELKYFGYTQAS